MGLGQGLAAAAQLRGSFEVQRRDSHLPNAKSQNFYRALYIQSPTFCYSSYLNLKGLVVAPEDSLRLAARRICDGP